jgi:hypothetical protein
MTFSIEALCIERCYAECRVSFIVMLNVIMLSVVIVNVAMLSAIMLSVVASFSVFTYLTFQVSLAKYAHIKP